jgi:hypothetical protein
MNLQTKATLGLGGALLAASLLAACGSGASSSNSPLPNTGNSSASNPVPAKSGLQITLKVPNGASRSSITSASTGREHPLYVSAAARGLEIGVSAGANSQTVYADISSTSPLCQTQGSYRTCTITVPTLGTTEAITGYEADEAPSNEQNGYGNGFQTPGPSQSPGPHLLAIGSATAKITSPGSVNQVSMGLQPIAAQLVDGGATTGGQDSANFQELNGRVVVTALGASASPLPLQAVQIYPYDANDCGAACLLEDPTPLPFVDVNGSPEPIKASSSSTAIVLGVHSPPSPVPTLTPPTPGPVISIPNDGYQWGYGALVLNLDINAQALNPASPPATVTVTNDLSATPPSPFIGGPYTSTLTYTIAAIGASSPNPASISLSGTNGSTTASVTGTDMGAPSSGIGAESTFTYQNTQTSGNCMDNVTSTQVDAAVSPAGSYDPTTGTQQFTIAAVAQGTCTFYLYDVETSVVTSPVSVTVLQ